MQPIFRPVGPLAKIFYVFCQSNLLRRHLLQQETMRNARRNKKTNGFAQNWICAALQCAMSSLFHLYSKTLSVRTQGWRWPWYMIRCNTDSRQELVSVRRSETSNLCDQATPLLRIAGRSCHALCALWLSSLISICNRTDLMDLPCVSVLLCKRLIWGDITRFPSPSDFLCVFPLNAPFASSF